MGDGPIPDDEHGADLPMNMTASVMLTGLPRDAHQALADVEAIDAGKGELRSIPDICTSVYYFNHRCMLHTRRGILAI